ncbi:MAG: C39 family peptidase [Sandaracinaceae bacterium]|nr:C39 family peptidase [Sandaracinaceae bacterium]
MTHVTLPLPPPSEPLEAVRALYDAGRFASALGAGMPDDLRLWPAPRGRILAARLAMRLGAGGLAQALTFRAYRDAPADAEAAHFMALVIHGRRGPWHALEWMRHRAAVLDGYGDAHAARAGFLASLRDFGRARAELERAAAAGADRAWVAKHRAWIASAADDRAGALAIVEEALDAGLASTGLLSKRATLLGELGRHEEALASLEHPRTPESFELAMHRAELAFTLRRYDACEADLELAATAARLCERPLAQVIARSRAEAAYLRGAYRRAEALARDAGRGFPERFAAALAALEEGTPLPRVELDGVPHIRQRHVTCLPSSLASLCAFHGDPVDHVEIADAICYAGTPLHRAVDWATARGYAVRQLDVDFARARLLIDAGFPFLLSIAHTVEAHSTAVVGYDLARRTLLLRDPSTTSLVELAEEALEEQAWFGPHGLVLAPRGRAGALEALDLGPTPRLWDRLVAIDSALDAHDVETARAAAAALAEEGPGSRIALSGALALAHYEGRRGDCVPLYDALMALHPECGAFVLRRGEAMRHTQPLAARLDFWRAHVRIDDPALLTSMAEDLRHEVAHVDEARRLLRRALRIAPLHAMAHHVLADLEASWDDGSRATAILDSYRLAACLTVADDHFAMAYYERACTEGRGEEALALLEERVAHAGDRALGPARTLHAAYLDAGNPERGVRVLEELAERRPEDGELALLIARAQIGAGDPAAAMRWLEASRERTAPAIDRHTTAAQVHLAVGALAPARSALEEALALAPWRSDLLGMLADVLAQLEGAEAATARVTAAFDALPEEPGLLVELCRWLRGRDDDDARARLESWLRARPEDRWARRELALVHASLGAMDHALELARDTVARAPNDDASHSVLGHLLARAGDVEGARASLRRALELWVDDAIAIDELAALGGGAEDAREDVRFVLSLLDTKISAGPGLLQAARAAACLPHGERRERLEALLARAAHRPDAWEALIDARLDAGEAGEALALCERALAQFPRWFRLHRLHADAHRIAGDAAAEAASLRALIALSPRSIEPRLRLAALLRERGDLVAARAVLDDALTVTPRSSSLRAERARVAWAEGARGDALDELLAALDEDTLDEAAFDLLAGYAHELGRADEAAGRLRAQLAEDDRDPIRWLRLALVLGRDAVDERARALRAALARSPREGRAADLLAVVLAEAGRFDEAIAACPPTEWVGPVPHPIDGRRAWVRARRGEVAEAIDDMLGVLERAPGYAWGRRAVCDWLDHLGRQDEFVRQAELLVAHAPADGLSHLYLADARRIAGDRAGAIEAFERTAALLPSHAYAVSALIDLRLETGDAAGAARVLDVRGLAFAPPERASARVRVEAGRGDWDGAIHALGQLLDTPEVSQSSLTAALRAFGERPRLERALDVVEARMGDPDASPAIGWAWAEVAGEAELDRAGGLLRAPDALGPAGVAAVAGWIERLGAARRTWAIFGAWLRHGRWLRRHDQTWGSFGYALLAAGHSLACLIWLRDYARRAAPRPWMLLNLVHSAWWWGWRSLARRATDRALALGPDHASARHAVWERFDRALEGDFDEPHPDADAELDGAALDRVELAVEHLVDALRAGAELPDDADDETVVAALAPHVDAATDIERVEPLLGSPVTHALRRLLLGRGRLWSTLRHRPVESD